MLRPSAPDLKVYLHRAPIDMRRGRNGLAAIVREVMQEDPFGGGLFLFIGKRFDALKILCWDRYGNRVIMGPLFKVGLFAAPGCGCRAGPVRIIHRASRKLRR